MWCAGCGASSVVAHCCVQAGTLLQAKTILIASKRKGNVFSSFEVLIVLVMTECLLRGVHDAGWIH
jgi:hypothetical protein